MKTIVYGIRPVIEAIRSDKEIDRIFIQSNIKDNILRELGNEPRLREINIQYVPIEKLNRLTRNLHQGIVAQISPIKYHRLADIIEGNKEKGKDSFIIMLDRVKDVRNLGAIARTAECSGVDAIIIPQHGSAQINEDAIKTSAGALLRIPVCKEKNLKTSINYAKQMGLKVFGASEKQGTLYHKAELNQPLMIIMGSEKSGVSQDILRLCDNNLSIPIKGEIESLNVSVAAGVLMYEVVRQRD